MVTARTGQLVSKFRLENQSWKINLGKLTLKFAWKNRPGKNGMEKSAWKNRRGELARRINMAN